MTPRPAPEPLALRHGRPLGRFLQRVPPLPVSDRLVLVEAARRLLEGYYVHLALKRSMYAVDPVQALRLLEQRVPAISDAAFHAELLSIFTGLRDLHTQYQLPTPYAGHVATLGFLVERYQATPRSAPRYVISKLHPSLRSGSFAEGVELVAWNGVPIGRAVERNAERASGSNPDARLARGLERFTLRPLRSTLAPDEEFVLITYRSPGGATHEARVAWRVLTAQQTRPGKRPARGDAVGSALETHGIDAGAEAARSIKRRLFAPPSSAGGPFKEVMRAERLTTAAGPVGYLRLYSFNVAGVRAFLNHAASVLAGLPQRGLIVDIRANPGGHIPAAEALLQLLTDRPVRPVVFSLATTPSVLSLCRENAALRAWAASVESSVATGEVYSQAFSFGDPGLLAEARPPYPGRVVLVTDALTYSAADIFAAGFQDNRIGPVLGCDRHTGAGGANVWTYDLLQLWNPDQLEALPRRASFRVALRRATRTGETTVGVPLEDLGVTPDALHHPTLRDLTGRNDDLLARAARLVTRRR